jgi:hypothetical protein
VHKSARAVQELALARAEAAVASDEDGAGGGAASAEDKQSSPRVASAQARVRAAADEVGRWVEVGESCARLYVQLADPRHRDAFRRYTAYALADYVGLMERNAVSPPLRAALLPGLHALLDGASPHEMQQLHAVLGAGGKALLKAAHEEFARDHKYAGKA